MYKIFQNVYFYPLKKTLVKVSDSKYEGNIDSIIENIPDAEYDDNKGVVYNDVSVKLPSSIQIYPTSNCNLRCKYCFNDSGNIEGRNLDFNKAKVFIEQAVRGLYIQKKTKGVCNPLELNMCGGGEPTYEWKLFQDIVDYAVYLTSKYEIPKKFQLTSNLFISNKEKLDYIIEKFDHVHISTDGSEEIQNYQRPAVGGRPSYPTVSNAIKYVSDGLAKKKALCGLRVTVSGKFVDKMEDIVEFVHSTYPNVRYIQFEPLNWVRKTQRTDDIEPPAVDRYSDSLLKAHKKCEEYNIQMDACFGGVDRILKKGSFCDAVLGHCLMLNYDGDIVNCGEASKDNPQTYKYFLVGHIDDEYKINWFDTPIKEPPKKETCTKCYAWYFCGGGCLHSILEYERNRQFRCALARETIKRTLSEIIEERWSAIGLNVRKQEYEEGNIIVYSW